MSNIQEKNYLTKSRTLTILYPVSFSAMDQSQGTLLQESRRAQM